MDLATLLGLLASLGLFFWAMWTGTGGDLMPFWDMPSAIMVIGGGLTISLCSVRMNVFLSLVKVSLQTLFAPRQDPADLIQKLVKLSETARRDGLLALQSAISTLKDPFLENGLQMVVDGNSAEAIKEILELELDWMDQRHTEARAVLELYGKYAPAMGMIGTLVGLVIMLGNMEDVSKIGPGMAVALLTTLYGAVIANMICLPLVDKLKVRHDQEMFVRSMMVTGILALQAGDNPRILAMKLQVFLPPKARAAAAAQKA